MSSFSSLSITFFALSMVVEAATTLSACVPNSKSVSLAPLLALLDDLNDFCSKPELSMHCNSRCRRTTSASLSSMGSSLICGPEGGEIDCERFLVDDGDLVRDRDLDLLEDLDRLLLDDFLLDFRFRSLLEDEERSLLESRDRFALLFLLFFDLWRFDLLDDLEESVEQDLERVIFFQV